MARKLLVLLYFGAVLSAGAGAVFPTHSTWRFFKGFSEASSPDPTAWRAIDFDDSSWPAGQAAFFFENQPGGPTSYTGNTLLDDMFVNYTCVFLRKTFVVTNVADICELQPRAFRLGA